MIPNNGNDLQASGEQIPPTQAVVHWQDGSICIDLVCPNENSPAKHAARLIGLRNLRIQSL
jgi:hypothetical protein